jgi:hypothetical protein
VVNEIIIVRCEGGKLQKYHPAEGVETIAHIIFGGGGEF